MGKVLFSYDHDPKQYPNEGEPTPDEDDIGLELYSHITDFIYENFDVNINEKKLSQGEIQDLEVARFKEVKARIDGQDFNWNGYGQSKNRWARLQLEWILCPCVPYVEVWSTFSISGSYI